MQRASSETRQPPPLNSVRELIRQKVQVLKIEGLFPEPAECGAAPESAWSKRYKKAMRRYEGLDLGSPEIVAAAIEGLAEWARLVPQRAVAANGTPQPVNKWGLGAERCILRSVHSHLVAAGRPLLAARIHSETADLLQTAESLDECCMVLPPDPHAEERLAATARIQTKALIKLLATVQLEFGRVVERGPVPVRRRGAPRRRNPDEDRRLTEEWARVRGKAGMTRKEFCDMKGISLQALVQAQDRVRKQGGEFAAKQLGGQQ